MPDQQEIMKEFADSNAIRRGHFVLSSGKHSDTYVQCALLLQNTQRSTRVCGMLVDDLKKAVDCNLIDLVIAPALGGVIVGYEIARLLHKDSIFCERVATNLTLRRDFEILAGMRLLLVDDVFTTGKSSMEVAECVGNFGAEIIAQAVLVDRSKSMIDMPFPLISLIKMDYSTYDASNLPQELANFTPIKPGSRNIKS
jgi:orotate phosphoribosyltransferase